MIKRYTITIKFNRNDTKSVEFVEIVARLLQYQNNPADIPAYLRHNLLEWLRNHG